MNKPAQFVDLRQVRRNFARAAARYESAAVLQREVGGRMAERLDYVRIAPQNILDLGCGTGASFGMLQARYPKAQIVGADRSVVMLQAGRVQSVAGARLLRRLFSPLPFLRHQSMALLAADAMALPCKSLSIGLLWSNLMLHWLDDPLSALREMHRVLEVGGLLMFSTFGPDTLKELRNSFTDGEVHTQRFADMHDFGDMLVASGFADPVMDMETLTLTYDELDALFRDLRQSGSTCAMQARRRGLMGRSAWQTMRANYEKLARDGRLPATFEIVYGHAWKAVPKTTQDGRAIVHFERKPAR